MHDFFSPNQTMDPINHCTQITQIKKQFHKTNRIWSTMIFGQKSSSIKGRLNFDHGKLKRKKVKKGKRKKGIEEQSKIRGKRSRSTNCTLVSAARDRVFLVQDCFYLFEFDFLQKFDRFLWEARQPGGGWEWWLWGC